MSGSNTKDLSERVADLEAWVETVMQLLSGAPVEAVLIKLDEARRAYLHENGLQVQSETMRRLMGKNAGT